MSEWTCYEAGADVYAATGVDDPAWRRRHRDAFAGLLRGPVVADLGCGPGYDLAAFGAMGLETIGVDGSAAMLAIAARHAPAARLMCQDVRRPLDQRVDGLWSMFAVLHVPECDLAGCFAAWRASVTGGAPLALGLVESGVVQTREVADWLGKGLPCVFHYHRATRVQELLSGAGWTIIATVSDTPAPYRGGIYDELELSAYVIRARVPGE